LKNGQIDINGNVSGHNVTGKHLIMGIVDYIGGEEKIIEKST
tara:strand:+ start:932 stop:1057 length:126 start_codon:yes stop_codon:yes gene_type:complete